MLSATARVRAGVPGETCGVAFRADNPGIWTGRCRNLDHAAPGMTMHLGYEGVSTPFMAGEATGNIPEQADRLAPGGTGEC